ncbi:hypothetical protein ABKN59_010382 [Abortiporus biennis]
MYESSISCILEPLFLTSTPRGLKLAGLISESYSHVRLGEPLRNPGWWFAHVCAIILVILFSDHALNAPIYMLHP